MKYKFLILFFLFLQQIQAQEFKSGDLLFIHLSCGDMCDAIDAVTDGYQGNDFNHVGIVVQEKEQFFVIEAISAGVTKTPLSDFIDRTDATIFRGRLKTDYQYLIPDAVAYCYEQIGLPYDDEFIYDNGKYYCSELIYDAFLYANDGTPIFQLFPMTYKKPNSSEFFPVWIDYFAALGTEIPEGKPGCNPGGMSKSNLLEMHKLQ